MMDATKPFEDIGAGFYTVFTNVVLDRVMPQCTSSEWKVLTALIRNTHGYEDKQRPGYRLQETPFSVRYAAKACGFKNPDTAAKALAGLRSKNMVVRRRGTRRDMPDTYWLNKKYTLHPVPQNGTPPAPKNGTPGVPQNGTKNTKKNISTKYKKKNNGQPARVQRPDGHNKYCVCEVCMDVVQVNLANGY